jgi:hypothetical protein
MESGEQIEREVRVRDERCKVAALKVRTLWKANGTYQGRAVEIRNAATAGQAFEWWQNKAEMMQPAR